MSDEPRMTIQDVADKMEWEGGVIECLEYGIKSGVIEDDELRSAWAELEEAYQNMQPMIRRVNEIIDIECGGY